MTGVLLADLGVVAKHYTNPNRSDNPFITPPLCARKMGGTIKNLVRLLKEIGVKVYATGVCSNDPRNFDETYYIDANDQKSISNLFKRLREISPEDIECVGISKIPQRDDSKNCYSNLMININENGQSKLYVIKENTDMVDTN